MDKPPGLIFVDCEAGPKPDFDTGSTLSPASGILTEFGAVSIDTGAEFHGKLFAATPDPENPALSAVGVRIGDPVERQFAARVSN